MRSDTTGSEAEAANTDSVTQHSDIEAYVEDQLFGDTVDTLAAHVERKRAVADATRYSILYYLHKHERVPRKRLAAATGLESNGLQHHLRVLLDANLVAEVPVPDGEDGRLTFYRVTTLGEQEIEADVQAITGGAG